MQKLSLEEVSALLGISNNSILNHITKDRLSSDIIKIKGEDVYVFDFAKVKEFASEFLDITLSEPEQKKEVIKTKTKKTKSKNEDNDSANVFENIIHDLKGDYNDIIKQFTDYKEQAAFQIGQLKGQMESNQKMLDSGRKEVEERDMLIRKLKMKIKESQKALQDEKEALEKMTFVERIFKIRRK